MTVENWRDVLALFERPNITPGTDDWTAWQTALSRAGFLGGESAVAELLERDRTLGGTFERAAEAFAGWAASDPDAAWEWLAVSPDERLRSALLPRFTAGVPEVSTRATVDFFSGLSQEEKSSLAVQTMHDIMETGGYDAADDLLEQEFSMSAGDPAAERVLQTLFDTVAGARQKSVGNGGSAQEVCDWLASYADRDVVRPEHFFHAASQLSSQQGAEAAADWLASVASEGSVEAVKTALGQNIREWAAKDPEAAGTWLKTVD